MNRIVINKEKKWDGPLWTDTMKENLKKGEDNHTIGMKLLLENDIVKVWGINLPPQHALPFHKHNRSYFYASKSKGKSRSYFSDGKIIETEYEIDDVRYFKDLSNDNYFIHNLENIGDTNLIFTTVEFKES